MDGCTSRLHVLLTTGILVSKRCSVLWIKNISLFNANNPLSEDHACSTQFWTKWFNTCRYFCCAIRAVLFHKCNSIFNTSAQQHTVNTTSHTAEKKICRVPCTFSRTLCFSHGKWEQIICDEANFVGAIHCSRRDKKLVSSTGDKTCPCCWYAARLWMRWSAFSSQALPCHTGCFYMFVALTATALWAARRQPAKTSLKAASPEIRPACLSSPLQSSQHSSQFFLMRLISYSLHMFIKCHRGNQITAAIITVFLMSFIKYLRCHSLFYFLLAWVVHPGGDWIDGGLFELYGCTYSTVCLHEFSERVDVCGGTKTRRTEHW